MLIIKTIDKENNRWKIKTKKTKTKEKRGDTSYSERVRAKWRKASLIFKSNLEFYQLF